MFGSSSPASSGAKQQRARLRIEALEDRVTPATLTLFNESFEGVPQGALPAGWFNQTLAGAANPFFVTATSVLNPGQPSPPNVAFGNDPSITTDNALVSPTIRINTPFGDPLKRAPRVRLSFADNFSWDVLSVFDGCVLEVSVNGAPFVDVTTIGTFVTGGYNATIAPNNLENNPVHDRPGWTITSNGWQNVQVDFGTKLKAGDTITFRWRIGTGFQVPGEGYAFDNVLLTAESTFVPRAGERFAIASGAGNLLQAGVNVYDAQRNLLGHIPPPANFRGEMRVATGDVNGDGIDDIITSAGPGGGPIVVVYDGATFAPIRAFFAYDIHYKGGVQVAAGDVTGDGKADIITAAGPIVEVFNGATGALVRSFAVYPPGLRVGVNIAAGDVDGDGRADIITGVSGNAPSQVLVFSGRTGAIIRSFFAYDLRYRAGVNVAAGDINGDGRAEIITAPARGSSNIVVHDGLTLNVLGSFAAFPAVYSLGGVRISTADVDGDGRAEITAVTGPLPGISSPWVFRYNLNFELFDSFFPFQGSFFGGGFPG
jgi:FG-GAP-like repeat/FG-GAP repeat